jgi:hypothetical protein
MSMQLYINFLWDVKSCFGTILNRRQSARETIICFPKSDFCTNICVCISTSKAIVELSDIPGRVYHYMSHQLQMSTFQVQYAVKYQSEHMQHIIQQTKIPKTQVLNHTCQHHMKE